METKILWVTDPWTTLVPLQDTTLRLAQEAQNMGFQSFWAGSEFVIDPSDLTHLKCIPWSTDFSKMQSGAPIKIKTSDFCHIHYRVDPPVDENYVKLVNDLLLHGAKESQILNPPALITKMSEKLPPKDLMHLAPRSLVIQNEADAKKALFWFQSDEKLVTKPMNLAQSQGVKLWDMKASSLEAIISKESENLTKPILVQEYLPKIKDGEVRLWFAYGEFIAALKKFPKSGDFRVLIDEGSKVEAYYLSETEEKIATKIGASLKKLKVAAAAIDLIGDKISDFNITSPGLLVQLEKVHGNKNFARDILKIILK